MHCIKICELNVLESAALSQALKLPCSEIQNCPSHNRPHPVARGNAFVLIGFVGKDSTWGFQYSLSVQLLLEEQAPGNLITLNSLSGGGQEREEVWILVTLHVIGHWELGQGWWGLCLNTHKNIHFRALSGEWIWEADATATGTCKKAWRAQQHPSIDGMKRGKGRGMAAVSVWKWAVHPLIEATCRVWVDDNDRFWNLFRILGVNTLPICN